MNDHYVIQEKDGLYSASVMGCLKATREEAEDHMKEIFELIHFKDARPQENLCYDAVSTNPPMCSTGMWLTNHKRGHGYQDNIAIVSPSREQAIATLDDLSKKLGCTTEPASKPLRDVAMYFLSGQAGSMAEYRSKFPNADFAQLFAFQCYVGFRRIYEGEDIGLIIHEARKKIKL